jgi:glutamate synthase domain-containing protein 2
MIKSLLPPRFFALAFALIILLISIPIAWIHPWIWVITLISGGLSALGFCDLVQKKQSIRRNYPILGHLRFFLEYLRPEIRQYFLEEDAQETPFSRNQRSIVYQRAKDVIDKRAFGTLQNVYAAGHEWINHTIVPSKIEDSNFRVRIDGEEGAEPYHLSVFNISAMSFGALSANAILALNKGAKLGGFAHDTGEGSISRHHREFGGDLIWEIGSGYFGCRTADGRFDPARFAEQANDPQVKMIEIKLSQGAKPGHGGMLPGPKVTPEIAEARGVTIGVDCISPAFHSEFTTPVELLKFVARLRTLSGGKPTGFKLCIGHPWEFMAIARAMVETGILPNFIVVDGAEGGTGAAPVEFADHVGTPLREGLLLVHNTLVGLNLRHRIKIGASGKIITAFDIARTMALGADWCNAARGFMFALGCIQAQACHTGKCPTGVSTQDALRQRSLVVPDKAERVANFHRNSLAALAELIAAAGLTHPDQLRPEHLIRRISSTKICSAAELYEFLSPGELLSGTPRVQLFARYWPQVSSGSFALKGNEPRRPRLRVLESVTETAEL